MSFIESISTPQIMPCTTLSWWLLVPKVPEEMGFAAPHLMQLMEKEEQDGFSLHRAVWRSCGGRDRAVTPLCSTGCVDWLVFQGLEKNSRLLTPYQNVHLCSLSAGKCHHGFALKKLLRLEGHPHPQGQDKKSWCLERHWGHSGPPDAGPVSNGTGSEQRSRLSREALASTLLGYWTKQVRGIYWEQWLLS